MVPNSCQIFGITLPHSLCLKNLELENSKLSRGPCMLSWLRWTQWIFESINDGNRNRSHWGFGSMESSRALHLFWKNVSSIGLYLLDFVLTVSIFPEKEIVTAYITFYPWCIILLTIETQKLRPGLKLFTRHNIGTARKE